MQTSLLPSVCRAFLGCQGKKAVDELNLTKNIISCHPSSLPFPDHVHCFVALDRSSRRLKFPEALLRIHVSFDGSMILFQYVVQVLHRSVLDSGASTSLPSYCRNRGPVNWRQVSVDHSRLTMGRSLSALRNSRLAAAASRNADNKKSMVAPAGIDGPIK